MDASKIPGPSATTPTGGERTVYRDTESMPAQAYDVICRSIEIHPWTTPFTRRLSWAVLTVKLFMTTYLTDSGSGFCFTLAEEGSDCSSYNVRSFRITAKIFTYPTDLSFLTNIPPHSPGSILAGFPNIP
jgi:hypothetical protein